MEFWLDEKIGSLPSEARLLYIGNIHDNPELLKGDTPCEE